jgi:MFS family permease
MATDINFFDRHRGKAAWVVFVGLFLTLPAYLFANFEKLVKDKTPLEWLSENGWRWPVVLLAALLWLAFSGAVSFGLYFLLGSISRGAPERFLSWLRLYRKFYAFAWDEFKRRWKRTPHSSWRFIALLISLIGLILVLHYEFGLTSAWAWTIVALSLLASLLAFVVELIGRYHQRTVAETYERSVVLARRIHLLSNIAGMATQIDMRYDNKEDEAPRETFRIWSGMLQTALSDAFGPSAVSDFTHGRPEILDVPDDRHVWFMNLRQMLSKVIDSQIQELKEAKDAHSRLGC